MGARVRAGLERGRRCSCPAARTSRCRAGRVSSSCCARDGIGRDPNRPAPTTGSVERPARWSQEGRGRSWFASTDGKSTWRIVRTLQRSAARPDELTAMANPLGPANVQAFELSPRLTRQATVRRARRERRRTAEPAAADLHARPVGVRADRRRRDGDGALREARQGPARVAVRHPQRRRAETASRRRRSTSTIPTCCSRAG